MDKHFPSLCRDSADKDDGLGPGMENSFHYIKKTQRKAKNAPAGCISYKSPFILPLGITESRQISRWKSFVPRTACYSDQNIFHKLNFPCKETVDW